MSTDTVYAWSTTADSNDTADAEIDWREYQATATVNNSARAMMRRVAQVLDDLAPNVTSTGSVNTYAVSSSSTGGGASLNDGEIIEFIPHITNTTACTLARDSKGAVPWRPKSGTEFGAGDIVAGVPVKATYRLASNEWLSSTPGYVFRTTAASYLTSHTFGLRVGDVKLSLASAPDDGFIRLTETTQALVKADYPDLNAWASGQGYPWGSTSTTFNVPPAGGYFLRFAASNATVDPDGARSAGVTQDDAFESHTHTATVTDPGHDHTYQTGNHANACAYTSQGFVDDKTMTSAQTTSSTTGVTVANSLTGGVETRGKNVAMHADMLANPALVAVSLIGANGLAYRYSTVTTATNPGSGYFSLNNATVGSATSLYISETDANGSNLSAVLAALPANTQLYLTKVGAPATFMSFVISSTQTDNGDWDTFPLSGPTSSGSFANGDMVSVSIMRPGPAGPSGSGSGDVVGPASGTDNAFARFDGATGKIIQNSTATLSDTGVAAGMKIIPTGASTARTLEARAADVINVKDFGAVGDGVTDDTTAITAAHTAMVSGGALYFPSGTYKVSSAITLSKTGAYIGDGFGATIFSTTSASATIFNVTASFAELFAMQFKASVTRTSGAFVVLSGARVRFSNFYMTGFWTGIQTTGTSVTIENGIMLDGVAANAIGVLAGGGADVTVRDITMDAAAQISAGIRVTNAADVTVEDCNLIHAGVALHIIPGAGQSVASVWANDCFFDNSSYGAVLDTTGGNIIRIIFDQCWFSSSTNQGVILSKTSGSGTLAGVLFDGCQFFLNGSHGLWIANSAWEDVFVQGCAAAQNGGDGINVAANTGKFQIQNCRIGASQGLTANANGIVIAAGSSDNYVIAGNDLRGNTSAALSDGGTGTSKRILGNLPASADQAWISYTPTITASSGTFTTVSATGKYAHVGGGVAVTITITITTNGTAAGAILATLPVASASSAIICGRENAVTKMMCQGYVASGASSVSITKYDNTYPGGNAYIIILSGVYEV